MTEYVAKIHAKMSEDMNMTATSPATEYLLNVVDGIELLDEQQSDFPRHRGETTISM